MTPTLLRIVLVTGLVSAFAACAQPPEAVECKTGITCPEGTKCAAVQQICIINDCGDGVVQSSEKCDDGNILDGDGCAANCLSLETCGDGVLNSAAGEICDDGNTTGGDGCASDCVSVEICGNGVRDVSEACDDGNTLPGDGCSGNCLSTEICGNNIVDIGEKCDDGPAPGGCNDDCQGGTGCGDGAIDRDGSGNALEECDDGNTNNQDDCTNQCNLNSCGDGIIQTSGARTEQCDPSVNFIETAGCNLDCTNNACGDNKINNEAGEECDDGSGMNADDRDCTSTCQVNFCGDGNVNLAGSRIEGCDDVNTNNFDGCSNICTVPTCGNGVIEMGEACDDDNTASGDGCSGPGTPGCQFESCGDGIVNNGEDCDAGVGGVATESASCNIDCTDWACGDGKVNKAKGEECDDMDTTNPACLDNCKLNKCGDSVKSASEGCDDGNTNNTDGCTNACTAPSCSPPNGIRETTEQCDDGNVVDTDGCLSTCVYATCGDGKVRTNVEECDSPSGNGIGKDCLPGCKNNICGDGSRDQEGASQEMCDLGSLNGVTACPYGALSCSTCTGSCSTPGTGTVSFCGDAVTQTGNGEACDDRSITQSCGQCDNACNAFKAAAQATAFLVATGNANADIADGDTFTINDGVNSVIFEFDKDMTPPASGRVRIDVSTNGLTSTQVRDKISAAIAVAHGLMLPIGAEGLHITTTDIGPNALLLKNERSSSIGNTTIARSLPGGSDFYIAAGFTGGAAGDCASGTPCKDNEDCLAADGTGVGTCSGSTGAKTCL
jgi:cysteine-rich repeat protein